jgi:hypothetical protein
VTSAVLVRWSWAFAIFCGYLREDLEVQLRDGSLEDITPEQAQQTIYGIKNLEGGLLADFRELSHR